MRLVVLTDRLAADRPLESTVAAAVAGGATTVVLREKDLPLDERRDLFDRLRPLVPTLLVADGTAGTFPGADGFHLSQAVAPHLDHHRPAFGISCHSAAEVAEAAARGASWVTLSPVFPSPSKPGYGPPLGVDALAGHDVPVLALGGVDRTNAAACLAAGAAGVAVMGAVMGAADPGEAVAGLLSAIGERVR